MEPEPWLTPVIEAHGYVNVRTWPYLFSQELPNKTPSVPPPIAWVSSRATYNRSGTLAFAPFTIHNLMRVYG